MTSESSIFSQQYSKTAASFLIHLERAKKNPDRKIIHLLRLDVKWLVSLCKLTEESTGTISEKIQLSEMLGAVFSPAGKLRNRQVQGKLIHGVKTPEAEAFREHLEKKKRRMKKGFKNGILDFKGKKFKKESDRIELDLRKITTEEFQDLANRIIRGEYAQIRKIWESPENIAHLHLIRKHLKIIFHMKSLLSTETPGKNDNKRIADLVFLDGEIGKWHDRELLIRSIQKFAMRRPNPERFESLISVYRSENERVLKGISVRVEKWIQENQLDSRQKI